MGQHRKTLISFRFLGIFLCVIKFDDATFNSSAYRNRHECGAAASSIDLIQHISLSLDKRKHLFYITEVFGLYCIQPSTVCVRCVYIKSPFRYPLAHLSLTVSPVPLSRYVYNIHNAVREYVKYGYMLVCCVCVKHIYLVVLSVLVRIQCSVRTNPPNIGLNWNSFFPILLVGLFCWISM